MPVRPFFETLRELRGGKTQDELADALNKVVAAVRDTGKPGRLTLAITVTPASKGDVSTVFLTDAVTVKAPELDRPATLFFATVENNLQRQDPNQRALDLRSVSSDDRTVDDLRKAQ